MRKVLSPVIALVLAACSKRATPAPAPAETVLPTLPLEVGEGDERGQAIRMYSDHGMLVLLSGDRIEKVRDRPEERKKVSPPKDTDRVRVTSGALKGEVGYIRLLYIQAAR